MKKMRKIVSVILCAVISCMCLISPVSAAEINELSPQAINAYGVVQLQMYPAIYDESMSEPYVYKPASTSYYSNGAGSSLINLDVDSYTKMIYRNNNCNAWVFRVAFAADSYVRNVKIKVTLGSNTAEASFNTQRYGYEEFLIPGDATYISYTIYTTFKDGTVFQSPGHVNI